MSKPKPQMVAILKMAGYRNEEAVYGRPGHIPPRDEKITRLITVEDVVWCASRGAASALSVGLDMGTVMADDHLDDDTIAISRRTYFLPQQLDYLGELWGDDVREEVRKKAANLVDYSIRTPIGTNYEGDDGD